MCPGPERLLLYRRRVWDYDCTVSELRACTMSSDNYCASALFLLHSQRHRSAPLHLTLLSLPGCCSAVIYLVPCRNLFTLLLQTPLHTYLSSNSFPPQITNRAHFLVGSVLTFCWSLPKFLVSRFQYFPRWREHFITFCFSCCPFAICTQYQEEP